MNSFDPNDERRASLSPEQMLSVNQHCDRRESQWRILRAERLAGTLACEAALEPEPLDRFLATVPAEDRNATAPELVLVDLEYRAALKLPISSEAFQEQIPWLQAAWLEEQITKAQLT